MQNSCGSNKAAPAFKLQSAVLSGGPLSHALFPAMEAMWLPFIRVFPTTD